MEEVRAMGPPPMIIIGVEWGMVDDIVEGGRGYFGW